MRVAVLVAMLTALLYGPSERTAGAPVPAPAAQSVLSLGRALAGRWVGVLEYRDYSEPAASTKRVQLPTWLLVEPGAQGLLFTYTYDDGPKKVLEERETVVFDALTKSYRAMENGRPWEVSAVSGLDTLQDGRGELVLTGPGIENDKPTDRRTTWTVRRNLLTILEETRPAGSQEGFAFRHRYVFTRAEAPPATVPGH